MKPCANGISHLFEKLLEDLHWLCQYIYTIQVKTTSPCFLETLQQRQGVQS